MYKDRHHPLSRDVFGHDYNAGQFFRDPSSQRKFRPALAHFKEFYASMLLSCSGMI